ncbi:hypothetical protein OGM63_08760 [Plectonema radiosum NIES-515]|uniref:Uncharacterized protein n=1 Tax=Plectonema radiosum NIES-515 TaxID=2986073 RepID=A0ABT3AY30_9CYAN|nr:hypothetical protein [Plectonema radiosum NIES-515]
MANLHTPEPELEKPGINIRYFATLKVGVKMKIDMEIFSKRCYAHTNSM